MSVHKAPIRFDRRHRGRGFLRAVGWMILGVLICTAVVITLNWRHHERVQAWHQPDSVSYSEDGEHTVTVFHTYTWGSVVGLGYDRYETTLGRDPGGGYGHGVRVEFTGASTRPRRVHWTDRGVTLYYAHGHRVFVPAGAFTGGR